MLPDTAYEYLLSIAGLMFWAFLAGSFLCVGYYIDRQIRAGQLIDGKSAPISFAISEQSGWLFVFIILALIYLQSVFYIGLVLLLMVSILLENRRTPAEQFGFGRLKLARVASWSLLCLGAVIFVEIPLTEGVKTLLIALHVPVEDQVSVDAFRQTNNPWEILFLVLEAVILAPIIEELFFRGFLFVFLKKYMSTRLALVLSAGVWAFAHMNVGVAIPLWFLGVVLGLAYENTGSLLLPMAIHACFNLTTALNLLLDKGSS